MLWMISEFQFGLIFLFNRVSDFQLRHIDVQYDIWRGKSKDVEKQKT